MNKLKKRIINLSYKHKLSHISSNLTAVDIIDKIYKKKREDDIFILSQGHAGLALYVVLEKYYKYDAEDLFDRCGVHPVLGGLINCSTGSLGHGLPIAVGMALAKAKRKVYCLISDGECDEGSIWESFNIMDRLKIKNIEIHLNYNGYSAYKKILLKRIPEYVIIHRTKAPQFLDGIGGHYKVLTKHEKYILLNTP